MNKNAVNSFWTGVYSDTNYYEWASNKAYLDFCRTIKDKNDVFKNKTDYEKTVLRKKGAIVIKSAIENHKPSFDEFHKDTCDNLIELYDNILTYGQAQKWLNMALKYLWLLYHTIDFCDEYNKLKEFIELYQDDFHVPLDSYILRYVAKTAHKGNAPTNNGLNKELALESADSWSALNDYNDYSKFQEDLRKYLIGFKNAIEWELVHWPLALKFYEPQRVCPKCKINITFNKNLNGKCPICEELDK